MLLEDAAKITPLQNIVEKTVVKHHNNKDTEKILMKVGKRRRVAS